MGFINSARDPQKNNANTMQAGNAIQTPPHFGCQRVLQLSRIYLLSDGHELKFWSKANNSMDLLCYKNWKFYLKRQKLDWVNCFIKGELFLFLIFNKK